MALIDELKEKRKEQLEELLNRREDLDIATEAVAETEEELADLDRAIAALEAPAQPLDELRTVPGAVEESRDHLIDAQTTDPVDPRIECASDEPDALAEFMKLPGAVKWEGGECPVPQSAVVEYLLRGADLPPLDPKPAFLLSWDHADILGDIIAYRVVSEPAEQYDDPTAVAIAAYIEAENEAPAPEQPASIEVLDEATIETINDLWQQGYDDKANGYEPSLAEPEYTKGYEARTLIEREHRETMERARFFDGGMMADADRHQSDQRGIVGVLTGMFKREREDA